MGGVCCGQTAYFAGGKEKVGVEQYTIVSWEIIRKVREMALRHSLHIKRVVNAYQN